MKNRQKKEQFPQFRCVPFNVGLFFSIEKKYSRHLVTPNKTKTNKQTMEMKRTVKIPAIKCFNFKYNGNAK